MKRIAVICLVVIGVLFMGYLYVSAGDPGRCISDCASEQGICMGNCGGDGQCISNCAAAHGRCVSRCH